MSTTGWCRDARSGHFPKLAERMHKTCAERLADPVQKPDVCDCDCHWGRGPDTFRTPDDEIRVLR